jgi:hypothetical protein
LIVNSAQCLSHECAKLFEKNGFKIAHRISAPLSTQSVNGDEIKKAKENKNMLGRDRALYIFKKAKLILDNKKGIFCNSSNLAH